MTPKQREFLTWWLIKYGTQKVQFYETREMYLGKRLHREADDLFDSHMSKLLFGHGNGFSTKFADAYLPQHILERLQDEQNSA